MRINFVYSKSILCNCSIRSNILTNFISSYYLFMFVFYIHHAVCSMSDFDPIWCSGKDYFIFLYFCGVNFALFFKLCIPLFFIFSPFILPIILYYVNSFKIWCIWNIFFTLGWHSFNLIRFVLIVWPPFFPSP